MKIVYLILGSSRPEHIRDEFAQRNTWASLQGAKAIWLHGGSSTDFLASEGKLMVKTPEDYDKILVKTILGIRWCLENLDFDFLIRANVSTYFRPELINKEVVKLSSASPIFAGSIEQYREASSIGRKIDFVNGGAIFLNYAACEKLCSFPLNQNTTIPDDVAISDFLAKDGSYPIFIPRGNISATSFLTRRSYYRLKSSNSPDVASKRMYLLHSYFYARNSCHKFGALLRFYAYELRVFELTHISLRNYLMDCYPVVTARLRIGLKRRQP